MQIVIDIPDDFYERVNKDGCMSYTDAEVVVNAFYCGEERKTGKWVNVRELSVECSVCHWLAPYVRTGCQMNEHFEPHITPFCPHCGSKMEADE